MVSCIAAPADPTSELSLTDEAVLRVLEKARVPLERIGNAKAFSDVLSAYQDFRHHCKPAILNRLRELNENRVSRTQLEELVDRRGQVAVVA